MRFSLCSTLDTEIFIDTWQILLYVFKVQHIILINFNIYEAMGSLCCLGACIQFSIIRCTYSATWKPSKCTLWFNHLWLLLDKIFFTFLYNNQAYVLIIQNKRVIHYKAYGRLKIYLQWHFYSQRIGPIRQSLSFFYLILFLNSPCSISPNIHV